MSSKGLIVSPYEVAELVVIRAVTNLHPGVGRSGEIVDLPVQRDNLGFPIIYSSSLKGALKSALWRFDQEREIVRTLFGPEPEEDEKFTSALAILDAPVIAFPVRSLEGVYAFATSPLLLHRLNEYTKMVGLEYEFVRELSRLSIDDGKCCASTNVSKLLKLGIEGLENRIIINEEIDVEPMELETQKIDKMKELEKLLGVEERLVLLSNNEALRAMERSLVRVTRIAIERERKTVKGGALWTEEYIPWGTIFTTVFLYSKATLSNSFLKKIEREGRVNIIEEIKKLQENAENTKDKIHKLLDESKYYLIIGGNETIGRGIVKLEIKDRGCD
jgi:CRISPR-associated protein Cmr4